MWSDHIATRGLSMKYKRMDWFIVVTSVVFSVSCGGGGCGGCSSFEPIPGGFPAAKRTASSTQLRVSSTGLAALAADPAGLLGSIGAVNGVLTFNAPVSCTGTTPTCCPGGVPKNPCGPIDIDLTPAAGDLPRLELKPSQGNARLDITVRARVKSEADIPVKLPLIGDCGLKIDTTVGPIQDVAIDAPLSFVADATAGTTRVAVGTVALANLSADDVRLTGGFFCKASNSILGLLLGVLRGQLTTAVQTTIQGQTCKKCPSGQVAECGSAFATACTNQVCMEGAQCFQELGLVGRVRGSALFASLSPGTTGALDLYEVAGTATSNNGGLALGVLGGMQPAGVARDRCGPAATPPPRVTVPLSAFFQGNTRPDTGEPFDVAFGVHASQLAELAYAGYDSGLLCLTIGHGFAAQLSSDTLSLLARSLGKLVESNAAMAVGIRPQRPPVIGLGKNTFTDDGAGGKQLAEPLIDLRFTAAELDFFVAVDDQWIRTFTVVADLHLPIGLQVAGMGQLTPVLGEVADAFTHVSVKNAEAITEAPADLAGLFPSLLALVLPQLSNGLSPVSLPALGSLSLDVKAITAVDSNSFLAIFANLAPAAAMARAQVETRASLAAIDEPSSAIARDPARWAGARGPSVTVDLGGDLPDLEWSYRLDDGTWSAWSGSPRQTVRSRVLWLSGVHRLEVRARQIGFPASMDDTPVALELPIGMAAEAAGKRGAGQPFHGQPGGAGCACDSSGGPGAAAPLALLIAIVLGAGHRLRGLRPGIVRLRRRVGRVGGTVWLVALGCLPGCSSGTVAPCSDATCLPGEVAHGSLGRFTSVAADGDRVVVATYDSTLGDLVVVDATDTAHPKLKVVDGVPGGVTATHDGGYRDGIEAPGPDVGAWTSIAISGGRARVAYQDRDSGALRYAQERSRDQWSSHVVDGGNGETVGAYASLAIDGDGKPAIAYLAVGNDDGMGHLVTELRIARATSQDPEEGAWSTTVVTSAPGSCAGLCGAGRSCARGPVPGMPERCVASTTDCAPACGGGDVCAAGACLAAVADPTVAELATGTGLFASLVVLPDGRLSVAYYDRSRRALELSVETGAGTNLFTETSLDAAAAGDRGMWASAAVDASGTIHVAYQDALRDQLMYTTWHDMPGTPEVVDDGQRAADRPHNVGAAAALYLVNGAPAIAYQDGLTADVYVATRSGAGWASTGIATGPLLDGFSIGATTGHGGSPVLAWGALDPAGDPIGQLVVESP
jgi:hypothetical protein